MPYIKPILTFHVPESTFHVKGLANAAIGGRIVGMCGIFAHKGKTNGIPTVIKGLKALEYRGYDSSGICFKSTAGLNTIKKTGPVDILFREIKKKNMIKSGNVIAHTRWATHGDVTNPNAHPHISCNKELAIVQNGIIENYLAIKASLNGHTYRSETDTEIIAHLIESMLQKKYTHREIIKGLFKQLKGSFALVIMFKNSDEMVALRKDCPLVIGLDKDRVIASSDSQSIGNFTKYIIHLPNKTAAIINNVNKGLKFCDENANTISLKKEKIIHKKKKPLQKNKFKHYMLQEIFEQQATIEERVSTRIKDLENDSIIDNSRASLEKLNSISRIIIFGCGTAWHACVYGAYLLRELGITADAWLSSELRYAGIPKEKNTMYIALSQSGETLDTLQCVRMLKNKGNITMGLTNTPSSQLAREADFVIHQDIGQEVGVAATKTYTSQLLELLFLSLFITKTRGPISGDLITALKKLAGAIKKVLNESDNIKELARKFHKKKVFFFIGRKLNVSTAYEGALKLKEITYLHAEGYAAGEMKHGPLALVDNNLVAFAIAPRDPVFDKIRSNIEEIKSRGGHTICVTTEKGLRSDYNIIIPTTHEYLYPILSTIPLQLFSYYVAEIMGREIDKPRNLAKSVTVE